MRAGYWPTIKATAASASAAMDVVTRNSLSLKCFWASEARECRALRVGQHGICRVRRVAGCAAEPWPEVMAPCFATSLIVILVCQIWISTRSGRASTRSCPAACMLVVPSALAGQFCVVSVLAANMIWRDQPLTSCWSLRALSQYTFLGEILPLPSTQYAPDVVWPDL